MTHLSSHTVFLRSLTLSRITDLSRITKLAVYCCGLVFGLIRAEQNKKSNSFNLKQSQRQVHHLVAGAIGPGNRDEAEAILVVVRTTGAGVQERIPTVIAFSVSSRLQKGLVATVHVDRVQMSRTALGVILYFAATRAAVLDVLFLFILKIEMASAFVSLPRLRVRGRVRAGASAISGKAGLACTTGAVAVAVAVAALMSRALAEEWDDPGACRVLLMLGTLGSAPSQKVTVKASRSAKKGSTKGNGAMRRISPDIAESVNVTQRTVSTRSFKSAY